jgi:putative tryptophan/tyrosine transport system substrate-binding protein
MRRREFIAGFAGAAVSPFAARGQTRVRAVGVLMPFSENDEAARMRVRAFRQELAKLGWSEGRDFRIDVRWATGDMDRVRAEAVGLVQSNQMSS